MITEDYVSFETAKLLKEKGFDENTPVNYFVGDDKQRGCVVGEMIHHKRAEEDTHLIACPTLWMAMKWLREAHNIFINISFRFSRNADNDINFSYYAEKYENYYGYGDGEFISYEEACEAAIKYCLEKLI